MLASLAKILVGEGLPVRQSHQKQPGQSTRPTSQRGNLDSWCLTQFRTATFGLSKRHICQESSKWRPRSAGRANVAGRQLSKAPRWWSRTTQRTGAEWRSLGRYTSVRVRLRSSSRCWTKRLFWRQKAWSNLCITCTVAFWQDTLTP